VIKNVDTHALMDPVTQPNQKPIPVLIMARELDQGGVERDVAKIAMGLDRSRFTPHVSTFRDRGLRYEELRDAGIPLLHLPLTSLLSTECLACARQMRRYLREHKIQVVHSYDASGVFGLPVARLSRIPVVIGSQLSYRDILDSRTQFLLRASDRFADAILVNCEAIRKYMIEHEGIARDRVEICYNGVVTSEFYPAEQTRPPEVAGASFVIGAVCALRSEKGLPLLQEAFARVRHLKAGMKLLLVGSGPELASLQANAERLGITADSVFVPASREVPKWLRTLDIFVLPSLSEAFSNALLEAMACGRAVVGSRVGGTPEMIGTEAERGFLFEVGNVGELAARFETLILNDDLRKSFGTRAADYVRQNLTIEIAVGRTGAMYERLLQRKLRKRSPEKP
jgi:glycosyltransferase involved in cell wall biosynthesis